MTETAILAAVGIVLIAAAAAVFFVFGKRAGTRAELSRQTQAKATAEETARRILEDAAREADSLRKTAVLTGKEELIRLREDWELEARKRREEIEADERRVQERENLLNRKYDLLEQREKDAAGRAADVGRRQEAMQSREQREVVGGDGERERTQPRFLGEAQPAAAGLATDSTR